MRRGNMMSVLAGMGLGAAAMGMMKNRNRGKVENMANDFLQSDMEDENQQQNKQK